MPRQLSKPPLLYYPSLLQYVDAVGMADSTEAMGNDQARPLQPGQAGGDHSLGAVVQGTGGLIEQDQGGLTR